MKLNHHTVHLPESNQDPSFIKASPTERAMTSSSNGSELDALGQAFQAFEWKGKDHHFQPTVSLPSPIPSLTVNGVGLLDLPLKEAQAKAIISTYAPRPSAANSPPVPVVIPPGKIRLTTEWSAFVGKQIMGQTVLHELGVKTPASMRLLRVTLHQPGTSTPLGYEKYNDGNVFATVSIVLPSQHTGGQFKIPNGKDKPPILYNSSAGSRSMASVLAWYTQIPTSVEPVTAGYRLAITYGIMHTGTGPKPSLPNPADMAKSVRAALQSWKDSKSTGTPATASSKAKIPLLAYALPGRVTDAHKGLAGLSPRNSFVAKLVLPIAKSLGLSVYLARLDKKLVGLPHEEHFARACIPGRSSRLSRMNPLEMMLSLGSMMDEDYEAAAELREDYLYGDYDTPDMGEIEREEQKLSQVTALDGAKALNLGQFQVTEENMVQTDAFYDAEPQRDDFDRDSGEVIHKFVRSALVFVRPAEHTNIVFSVMGPYSCLKELPITNTSTEFAQMVISASLEKLAKDAQSYRSIGSLWDSEARLSGVSALRILAHAIAWNDHLLWNKAIRYCKDCAESDCVASIANALKIFKVELVKEGIITLIKATPSLSRSFSLMDAVSSNDASGSSGPWLAALKTAALSACKKPTVADVPALISISHSNGPASILPVIAGIDKTGTYDVFIGLAKALHEQTKSAALANDSRVLYEEAVRECISAAVPQWESSHEHSRWFRNEGDTHETPLTQRVCDIVLFCCAINYVQPCVDLFASLLHFKSDDISSRLKDLHAPVCFHLKRALAKQGKSTMQEPFLSLYRNTIAVYLERVLGTKPVLPALPAKAIGCGCADCTQLDKFLRNDKETGISFEAIQSRRTHIESQIRKAKAYLARYVTTDTDKWGKTHTLNVRKSREVAAALAWGDTKAKAEAFIKCICADEATLRAVMGSRYEDVVNALNGTKAFGAGSLFIPGASAPSIGTKRKRD